MLASIGLVAIGAALKEVWDRISFAVQRRQFEHMHPEIFALGVHGRVQVQETGAQTEAQQGAEAGSSSSSLPQAASMPATPPPPPAGSQQWGGFTGWPTCAQCGAGPEPLHRCSLCFSAPLCQICGLEHVCSAPMDTDSDDLMGAN